MMIIDWPAALTGFGVGVLVSSLYFAGLALTVRLALASSRPHALLLPSALVRIGLLLAAGWLVTAGATLLWSLAGYGLAFFVVRLIAIAMANAPRPEDA
ncbi:ATP synthase subunit I [Marinobacter subterrani]|uniref:N-ATPase, AtpR subunit n=1 Tax=Marinobacter subterrani TaxID=1658765 RepID=A0A0J7J5E0_9GAMM|nr:ATP synthase subunit I [Marinobacter subterrani]KMQ73151.1 N-ATPase, AtpR subunit [Marinobacter subterrani]